MKLGPQSKLENRNPITSKRFTDNVMSANYNFFLIFSNYGLFGAIRKPGSVCMVVNS